jgi:hypothetical protein
MIAGIKIGVRLSEAYSMLADCRTQQKFPFRKGRLVAMLQRGPGQAEKFLPRQRQLVKYAQASRRQTQPRESSSGSGAVGRG